MNTIEFRLHHIPNDNILVLDGVEFRNAAIVKLFIDGSAIETFDYLDVVLIVFSELVRSLAGDGSYLFFTSASGIADEGGWEGVEVRYDKGTVSWAFSIEDKQYRFVFNENEYRDAIKNLKKDVKALPQGQQLEPTEVFFPESWDR
jgi:hypothetical protein